MSASFSAVLLAGGKSRRMGRDKAFLELNGLPLWQRQLQILRALAPQEIFLAGPAHPEWIDAFDAIVPDAKDEAGPLAGLVAALRRCQTKFLLALAVDLPNITTSYLRELLDSCAHGSGAVPLRAGRFEPLAAVFPSSALALAESALAFGSHSLQPFVRRLVQSNLLSEISVRPDQEPFFRNLNTPSDLSPNESSRSVSVTRVVSGQLSPIQPDHVATEEPLELRIEGHSVAVVMRTPGHDRELAAGFLMTENLVRAASDIFEITLCGNVGEENVVNVTLRNPAAFDPARLTRHVFSSSSCGVCSKATLDAVRLSFAAIEDNCRIAHQTLLKLPARLRAKQETFDQTGGLHACALFDSLGNLQALREDVGRHNALDKLIGHALLQNRLPLRDRVLLLSGRVSFEMMQKALAAGIPIVAAISAPTSLAIEFARENNQTLIGFLRGETMNIYAGRERVIAGDAS